MVFKCEIFPCLVVLGQVSMRTHCHSRVVNRMSRFHKSAGLDEIGHTAPGRHSPVLSGSPGSTGWLRFLIRFFLHIYIHLKFKHTVLGKHLSHECSCWSDFIPHQSSGFCFRERCFCFFNFYLLFVSFFKNVFLMQMYPLIKMCWVHH